KSFCIKLAKLIMSDTASHHRHVIYVSVRDHRFQSVFGIARGKLVLDMFIPPIRKDSLGVRQTLARQMTHEEFKGTQAYQLSRFWIVMGAGATKSMLGLWIIVDCDQRMGIKRGMNLLLCFGRTVFIFSRDVQHERGG